MCEGEINQAAQTYNYRQTENYLDNIYKTACLFAASCREREQYCPAAGGTCRLIHHFGLYLLCLPNFR